MLESIKVGLLTEPGGPHLDIYLDCLTNCKGVAEVSIADSGGESFGHARTTLARRFAEVRTYTDYRALLRERRPDLAVVLYEPDHAPVPIQAALDANCHVLAEKPACIRAEDFARLNAIAEARHRYLMLAFATRSSPLAQKARELAGNGSLGKLYGVSMFFLADQTRLQSAQYQRSWFASRERAGGGHLAWLGIHYVDIVQFISHQQVTRICGFAENVGGQPIGVEDSAAVSLDFDGGLLGTLQCGYYLNAGYQSGFALWGSAGWLRVNLDQGPLEWRLHAGGGIQSLPGTAPNPTPLYPAYVQAVVDAVRGRVPPPITGREGLATLRAVFGLYQAAATGQTQVLASR